MEKSLWSGDFPTLTEYVKQATASSSSNNKGNNNSDARYHKKPTVACIDPPAELSLAENQPGSPQFASAPSFPHTATVEPVHHVTPAWQERQPRERRRRRKESEFTPLLEPLNAVFLKVASLLELPEIRPPPDPLPQWYKASMFCKFHRASGHSTNKCYTL